MHQGFGAAYHIAPIYWCCYKQNMLLGVAFLQFLAYWELTCFQQYIGATATVTIWWNGVSCTVAPIYWW
jgi:hypothetical protein